MYQAVAKLDLFGPEQPREMVLTGRLRAVSRQRRRKARSPRT